MTRYLAILFFLVAIKAQASPDTLYLSAFEGNTPLNPWLEYAVYEQSRDFENLSFEESLVQNTTRDSAIFLRFYVKNDLEQEQKLFIHLNRNEFWELLDRDSNDKPIFRYAGYLEDHSKLDVENQKYFLDIDVKAGELKPVILKTYNISTRLSTAKYVDLLSELQYYKLLSIDMEDNLWGFSISVFFQGAIGIMTLYMLLLYFQNNRDKTYLYYGLYLFCGLYYLLQKIGGQGPFFFIFPDNAIIRHLLNDPFQWLIYIFYNMFVIYFLEIKRHSMRLYKFLKVLNVVYFMYMLLHLTFMLITFDKVTEGYLFVGSRLIVIVIAIWIILEVLRKIRTPLAIYIVIGSLSFLLFTVTSMLYSLHVSWLPDTDLYAINFMQIGIMVEVLCFSLGLGKRIRLADRESEKLHKAYIDQLIRNEEIIQLTNKKLSVEVDQRASEVMYKTKELEHEREEKIKAKYEKQLTESEMSALRLQMNPHFIFNSLNAIRYYILKEDPEKASDYITAFSKLLRMILQHSKQKSVKLSEELEALKLYVDFERQRFENKFEFTITISEEVKSTTLSIQPMIIQPFIENSIWHGLMHMDGSGHLQMHLSLFNSSTLQVVIEDNGIGREKSKEYSEQQENKTYKSMGMQITRDRLKLMEQLETGDTGYEVVDLYDENNNSVGTKVIIKMRLK